MLFRAIIVAFHTEQTRALRCVAGICELRYGNKTRFVSSVMLENEIEILLCLVLRSISQDFMNGDRTILRGILKGNREIFNFMRCVINNNVLWLPAKWIPRNIY